MFRNYITKKYLHENMNYIKGKISVFNIKSIQLLYRQKENY